MVEQSADSHNSAERTSALAALVQTSMMEAQTALLAESTSTLDAGEAFIAQSCIQQTAAEFARDFNMVSSLKAYATPSPCSHL